MRGGVLLYSAAGLAAFAGCYSGMSVHPAVGDDATGDHDSSGARSTSTGREPDRGAESDAAGPDSSSSDGGTTGGAPLDDTSSSTGLGDPPFDDPFDPDAELITVQEGIDHVEGPTWVPLEQGFVYHTRPNVHRLWRPFESTTSAWYELPGGNHGSHYDDGWVYLANRSPAEIARIRVADLLYESLDVQLGGQVLALPNDIDRFADGSLYFTDWGGAQTPPDYIGYGVYRRFDDGEVQEVITDLSQPNGIAFTADCETLYVTDNPQIYRYDVSEDGSVDNPRVHFEIGQLNGIAVDAYDNLYTVGDNKITAIDDDGEVVGELELPGHIPVNLAFGGEDRQILLITTTDGVLATRTRLPGAECNGL